MRSTSATVVVVPGLRDHVAEHWQTLLAARLPHVRAVAPMGRANIDCDTRVEALDGAVADLDGDAILVAHSGGVISVVHWARRYGRTVKGALLAAPPDFERPLPAGYPTMSELDAAGWLPVPRERLPFPSIVATSSDDPLARSDRVRELACAWGSRLVELGAVGHLNPASGYGEWPLAERLIAELGGASPAVSA